MKTKRNFFLLIGTYVLLQFAAANASAQNTCATATPIHYENTLLLLSGSTTGVGSDNSTSGAGQCVTSVGVGGQKWYSFTWPGCDPYTVSLSTDNPGTNFDTKLHVYTGTCGSLACVTGDDDGGIAINNASRLTFVAQPNTTYLIRVGGFNALAGNYVLSVAAGFGGCTDPAACNYQQSLDWDDCSCCYTACNTLSLAENGYAGPDSYIRFEIDGTYYGPVLPGESITFCEPLTCGATIQTVDGEMNGWGGLTYTLTANGQTVTNIIPEHPAINNYIDIPTPWCGCMDVQACNYEATAIIDDGSCLFRTNGDCSTAQYITAPTFINTTTICEEPQPSNVSCLTNTEARDLWYAFTYEGGTITFDGTIVNGEEGMLFAVWDDCDGNLIYCDNNYNKPYKDLLILSCMNGLEKGHTYLLQFGSYEQPAHTLYLDYKMLPLPGCVDENASNFNACASVDDGTCVYASCEGDFNGNGSIEVNDLLHLIGIFGTVCP